MAYFRWFEHGANTILGSLAGPHELFLLSQCDGSPLPSIARKTEVDCLGRDRGQGAVEHDFLTSKRYFYRLHWHSINNKFTDAALHQEDINGSLGTELCDCCTKLANLKSQERIKIMRSDPDDRQNLNFDIFRRECFEYLVDDFFYFFYDHDVRISLNKLCRSRSRRETYPLPGNQSKEPH